MLKLIRNNDERDFKRAKNIVDFAENYLKVNVTFQSIALARMLGETCPYCSDLNMRSHPDGDLDRVVLLVHGVCPRCNRTKHDQHRDGYWGAWNQVSFAVGQRGGKKIALAILSLYMEHRMLTLEVDGIRVSPVDYYGFNVSASVDEAKLYNTLHAGSSNGLPQLIECVTHLRLRSPWYVDYFSYLDQIGRLCSRQQYVRDDNHVHFKNKNLVTTSMVNDVRRIRGKTVYFSGLYDMAWLQGYDPNRVVRALDTAMTSSRERCTDATAYDQMGLLVSLTSRHHAGDIFDKMSADANCYSQTFATWEFMPDLKRSDFARDYEKNPIATRRDFECIV